MSIGGTLQRENKKGVASAPPPATVTAANDGLSLSGTTAQLGQAVGAVGNPAILTNNREIPMGAFSFLMQQAGNRFFSVNPQGQDFYLGDKDSVQGGAILAINNSGTQTAFLHGSTGITAIGDVYGDGNGTGLNTVDGGIQPRISMLRNGNIHFLIDFTQKVYELGDDNSANNGGLLKINDNSLVRTATLGFLLGNQSTLAVNDINSALSFGDITGGFLNVDIGIGLYYLGDNSGIGNGMALNINDATGVAKIGDIGAAGNSVITIRDSDAGVIDLTFSDTAGFGAFTVLHALGWKTDVFSPTIDASLVIDSGDAASVPGLLRYAVDLGDGFGGINYLKIDPTNSLYQFGNASAVRPNGTLLSIDDAAQTAMISGNGNNGLLIDFLNASTNLYAGDNAFSNAEAEINLNAFPGSDGSITLYVQDATTLKTIDIEINSFSENMEVLAANGIKITGDTTLLHTGTALANGAGVLLGTLGTSPIAGNPTKWIPVDDNGTTRYIPAW